MRDICLFATIFRTHIETYVITTLKLFNLKWPRVEPTISPCMGLVCEFLGFFKNSTINFINHKEQQPNFKRFGMSFDVELGQRTVRLSETVHLSLDSLWFSSSLLSSVQFHFQTWQACSIIQNWKHCLGMSRFSCYNSLLPWKWQVRISCQNIWLIYSPLYRNYSSSSMA